MKFVRLFVITLALTIGLFSYAHAGLNNGARVAISEVKKTIDELKNIQIKTRLHIAVAMLVDKGATALAQAGHISDANRIRQEWQIIEKKFFGLTEALGDHRPLSQWLGTVYKTMEQKLGKARLEALHLDDINVVNYAVPVVITPRAGWNKAEYGLHFVPFTGVLVYWSSLRGCISAFNGNKRLYPYCDRVANMLERKTNADIAPKLSDYVFERFNGINTLVQFNVTEDQMIRLYGDELSRLPQ